MYTVCPRILTDFIITQPNAGTLWRTFATKLSSCSALAANKHL